MAKYIMSTMLHWTKSKKV